jgi:DNA-binding NtrC family response regulator
MPSILVVEDKESMRKMLKETLAAEGYFVDEAADGLEAQNKINQNFYDLVLTDLKLPKKDGLEVLRLTRENSPQSQVILMTAYGTIDTAVAAMKEGALDFLTKPFDTEHLLTLVKRATRHQRLLQENLFLRQELGKKVEIVGQGPAIKRVLAMVQKVAPSKATVLLTGESGTGKELFARAIHHLSPRRDQAFIAINCAAIPDTLLESELFGHEKGAFTGAVAQKQGKFELADGGTIFLDEVGELSQGVQAKLLRVLQDSSFERVGGTKLVRVDARVISSTNANLQQVMEEKKFREDLFYRLNVFPVHIPPLRERPEDIGLITQFFLSRLAPELGKSSVKISEEALKLLESYSWPGNVRELENVLERAAILCGNDSIQAQDLEIDLQRKPLASPSTPPKEQTLHAATAEAAERIERALILTTLDKTKGNKSKAARILGVSYMTLLTKIKKYGLKKEEST